MDSNHQIAKVRTGAASEAELEILIARYTLEYLYRWTNHFDAVQLAQIRQLFETHEDAGSSTLLNVLAASVIELPS